MNRSSSPRYFAAAAAVLALGLTAAPAAVAKGAAATPSVPKGPGLKVTRRPHTMTLGDNSPYGLSGRGGRIHWQSWGRKRAIGTGIEKINTCEPDCAAGHFKSYPVKIVLSDPRLIHGPRMFRDLTLVYTRREPSRSIGRVTRWVDSYEKGVDGSRAMRLWIPQTR